MKKVIVSCVIIASLCAFGCSRHAEQGAAPSGNAGAAVDVAGSEAEKADVKEDKGNAEAAEVKADGADAKAQAVEADANAVKYVDADGQPLGLQLDIAAVLPGEVTEIERKVGADGIYHLAWLFNGMVSYSLERLPKAELGEGGVRDAFAKLEPDAYDASLRPDDDMTRRLDGAVTWRWYYSTGHNEDTRTNTDYYIQRDDFDYRFSVSVPADFADEYKQPVKALVNGLVFVTR